MTLISLLLFVFLSLSHQTALRPSLHRFDSSERSSRGSQSQAILDFGAQRAQSVHLPLFTLFAHDLNFCTDVSIGTPPQQFQVLVDISSADTFVSSVNCSNCAAGGGRYDSSASTSSRSNGSAQQLNYRSVTASGELSEDVVSLSSLRIQNQQFLEATSVEPTSLSWDNLRDIHGVIGLSPSSAASDFESPSLFMSMASQKILGDNSFSLRLRAPAELAFGGVNRTLFTGNLTRIPITNRTSPYGLTGRWQVNADYLAVGSKPGWRHSLSGLTTSFTTSSAFILLPDLLAYNLLQDLEFEDIGFMPLSVACEKREFLPSLTFNLAGHNLTLAPYDWTFEWPMRKGDPPRCVSAVMPIGIPDKDLKEIQLGSAFLRTFYSVFDLDTKTVGFANLSRIAPEEVKLELKA